MWIIDLELFIRETIELKRNDVLSTKFEVNHEVNVWEAKVHENYLGWAPKMNYVGVDGSSMRIGDPWITKYLIVIDYEFDK